MRTVFKTTCTNNEHGCSYISSDCVLYTQYHTRTIQLGYLPLDNGKHRHCPNKCGHQAKECSWSKTLNCLVVTHCAIRSDLTRPWLRLHHQPTNPLQKTHQPTHAQQHSNSTRASANCNNKQHTHKFTVSIDITTNAQTHNQPTNERCR